MIDRFNRATTGAVRQEDADYYQEIINNRDETIEDRDETIEDRDDTIKDQDETGHQPGGEGQDAR